MARDPTSSQSFAKVHNSLVPNDVRENDRVLAHLRHKDSQQDFQSARVWRISPFGVEIVEPSSNRLNEDDIVDVQITVGGERSQFRGLVVHQSDSPLGKLIGIRFVVADAPEDGSDRRTSPRWICSEDFLPIAVAAAPGKFNYFMRFQIRNISREGLELYTELSNKHLLIGMSLSLTMSFPLIGEATAKALVKRVNIRSQGGREILSVGVELADVSATTREVLSQYLVQFSNVTSPDELRVNALGQADVAKGLDFRFLKTEAEYTQLLELRKANSSGSNRGFGEARDQICRIAMAEFHGQLAAVARVGFPNSEQRLSTEQLLDGNLPRRDQILEVEGVQINRQYLDTNVVVSLLKFICTTCVTSQRPYVLLTIDKGFFPFDLAKIGWKHVAQVDTDTSVFIGNAFDACVGRSANPLYWNYVWRDVSDYLIANGVDSPIGIRKAMHRVYKLFGPIAKLYFSMKKM